MEAGALVATIAEYLAKGRRTKSNGMLYARGSERASLRVLLATRPPADAVSPRVMDGAR